MLAEIELSSESQKVSLPDWVGDEVTGINIFYNSQLSKLTDSEVDNLIRNGLKNSEAKLYLHKSAKPLGEIDFLEPKKQPNLFGETFDEEFADECEGLCGV